MARGRRSGPSDFIPDLKVEGLKELRDKVLALGPETGPKVLRAAARAAMQPVLEEARRLVPVDSGLMRDSIVLSSKIPKSGDTVTRVGIRIKKQRRPNLRGLRVSKSTRRAVNRMSAHWRWHFIEFGTVRQKARPFLRPALATHKDRVIASIKAEIAKRVERVWRYRRKQAAMARAVFGG